MFSSFLTQRTKSKFVISKEGNVAETLHKFIRPEDVSVQYGGLSRPSDLQNGPTSPFISFPLLHAGMALFLFYFERHVAFLR